MTEPSPRKFFRFQFHLWTAIVMMFVAGALIWANTIAHPLDSYAPMNITFKEIGFPYAYLCIITVDTTTSYLYNVKHYHIGMVVDIIIAFAILYAVWYICEWLIRRRTARK